MEKVKKIITVFLDKWVLPVCIAILIFCLFWSVYGWYTAGRTANDYNNVNRTVQSVKDDNQQARQQIGNASTEVEHAKDQLGRSVERTDGITNRINDAKIRTDRNAEIIEQCEDIIDAGRRDTEKARSIFTDIDKTNQGTGAQADSDT